MMTSVCADWFVLICTTVVEHCVDAGLFALLPPNNVAE